MAYIEYDTQSPFSILLKFAGTVWPLVLPYCILNCVLLIVFQYCVSQWGIRIYILPQGHALMSILIAYLGVSKVNLAYERYMSCRTEMGRALSRLREAHQYAITLSENDISTEAIRWRKETRVMIEQLIRGVVTMVKNSRHAQQLATSVGQDQKGDPFEVVHYLRCHLFEGSKRLPIMKDLSPLERCKLLDILHEFTTHFSELVRLASTPIPFALVQMGRTFIFIWVLSLPFVLTGEDFDDLKSVMLFVVLLTYGFLGLEFVAMKMSNPFGDEAQNDLDVKGMAKATILGMENDATYMLRVVEEAREANARRAPQREAPSARGTPTARISQRILRAPSVNLDHNHSKDTLADDSLASSTNPNSGVLLTPAIPGVPQLRISNPTIPKLQQMAEDIGTTVAGVAESTTAAVTPYFAMIDNRERMNPYKEEPEEEVEKSGDPDQGESTEEQQQTEDTIKKAAEASNNQSSNAPIQTVPSASRDKASTLTGASFQEKLPYAVTSNQSTSLARVRSGSRGGGSSPTPKQSSPKKNKFRWKYDDKANNLV